MVLLAVAGGACGGREREARATAAGSGSDSSARLAAPYPVEPFTAVDLDGRQFSLAAWKGHVVVINVWATWCAPCRRELPALAALQDTHRERVRVLGLLQDTVTPEFAREFVTAARINYPIVWSTFDIERRLPAVPAIPMTFVLDQAGQLVATYAGEIDPAQLEREVLRLSGR